MNQQQTIPDFSNKNIIEPFDLNYTNSEGIAELELPESIYEIRHHGIFNTYIRSIKIDRNLRRIDDAAFGQNEYMQSFDFNGNTKLTEISKRAFHRCFQLESVDFPENIETLGSDAFRQCINLKRVKFNGRLKRVLNNAFGHCYNLTDVELPQTLGEIGKKAFAYCFKLERIVIPPLVTRLEKHTFKCCENLKSVTLPAGIEHIAEDCFFGCYNLENVDAAFDLRRFKSAFKTCRIFNSL